MKNIGLLLDYSPRDFSGKAVKPSTVLNAPVPNFYALRTKNLGITVQASISLALPRYM